MAHATTLSALLAAAITTLLLPLAAGHGFIVEPAARNLLRGWHDCPHCVNYGGPFESSGGGRLTWPASVAPVCGSSDLNNPGNPVRRYSPGDTIEITIFVTAQHGGRHVFRLCPDSHATDGCLRNLQLVGGGYYAWTPVNGGPVAGAKYGRGNEAGVGGEYYTWRFRLPSGLTCSRCTLQWWWTTANSCRIPGAPSYVGGDPGMSPCTEPGPYPEEFWNCADIAIGAGGGSGGSGGSSRNYGSYSSRGSAYGSDDTVTAADASAARAAAQRQAAAAARAAAQAASQAAVVRSSRSSRANIATGASTSSRSSRSSRSSSSRASAASTTIVNDARATAACKRQGFMRGGGFYALAYDCSKYLQCSEVEGWVMPCPTGLVWDDTAKACNHRELTDCGRRPIRG